MKITCGECGTEINWWETTECQGKLSACPNCDKKESGETYDTGNANADRTSGI